MKIKWLLNCTFSLIVWAYTLTGSAWSYPAIPPFQLNMEDTILVITDSCKNATPICGDSSFTFAYYWGFNQPYVECCEGDNGPPIWGDCCLDLNCPPTTSLNSPKWFVIKSIQAGQVKLVLRKNEYLLPSPGLVHPPNRYYLWGPYDTPDPPCVAGLVTEKLIQCKNGYSSTYYNYDTVTFNAENYRFYYLLTFMDGYYAFDTLYLKAWQANTGEPNAGVLSCDGITSCAIYATTAQSSVCDPTTNIFTLSGKIFFYNAPTTGTLVVWDNQTGNAATFYPPFNSPTSYSITGIPCDNATHEVTAMFMEETGCWLSQSFQAPVLCPDAILSGGGYVCTGDSISLTVNISPYVQTPVYFILSKNEEPLIPIIYSGPFPYQFWTDEPGVYAIDTIYNALCSGNPTGSAIISLWPLPQPNLGEDIISCEGRPVLLDAGMGYKSYIWNTDEATQCIFVTNPGFYNVRVTDFNNCTGRDEIEVNFSTIPQPVLIKHQ